MPDKVSAANVVNFDLFESSREGRKNEELARSYPYATPMASPKCVTQHTFHVSEISIINTLKLYNFKTLFRCSEDQVVPSVHVADG